jgi:hypothetical protein
MVETILPSPDRSVREAILPRLSREAVRLVQLETARGKSPQPHKGGFSSSHLTKHCDPSMIPSAMRVCPYGIVPLKLAILVMCDEEPVEAKGGNPVDPLMPTKLDKNTQGRAPPL